MVLDDDFYRKGYETYLVFFLLGYILATDLRYREAIQKVSVFSLVLTFLTTLAGYFLLVELGFSGIDPLFLFVRAANSWFWLMALIGFRSRYLNSTNRTLRYTK